MPRCNLCLLSGLLACTGDKQGWDVPYGQSTGEPASEPSTEIDTGEEIPTGYQIGDPMVTTSTFPDPPLNNGQILYEWVDVAIYDQNYAVQVGVSGVGLVSRQTGEVLDSVNNGRAYTVDSDGDLIVVGSRTHRIALWRFQEGETLSPAGFIEGQGVHEKVAVDNELVAVAWRDQGVRLYQSTTDVQLLSTIPTTDAYAVDIVGDRLFYSDAAELVMVDVSDPANPLELQRVPLDSEVRDIDASAQFVALGLGGNGVQVLALDNDRLISLDTAEPPGGVFSLSLDQSFLWVASWETITLYTLENETLLPLGQEKPLSAAMGVAASNGQAVVADWYQSTIVQQVSNRWGAEVHLPTTMRFHQGESVSQTLWVYNYGAEPLELFFDNIPSGFSVEETQSDTSEANIPVGGRALFRVSVPNGSWSPTSLSWTSNDPDEATGRIDIRSSNAGEGALHPDFALPLVSADGIQGTGRLADYQGKVLFLSWWSDY